MKKVKIFRRIMLFWTLFIGIGAVCGATGMLVAPDGSALGMNALLPYFQVLPFADILFQNFTFPGIALLIVNGITNLVAAVFLFLKKNIGAYLGSIFGFTLMLWIIIQFVIFPANFMSSIYFVFGFLQCVCGINYIIFLKQNEFTFDVHDYPNVNKGSDILVVYFSRRGYCKKVAYEKANELGADIREITTNEKTQGFFGFAWLGRFGMHGWSMPVNDIDADVADYEKLIIVSPIHVFSIAPPVKGFCERYTGRFKQTEYIALHSLKNVDFKSSFDELDKKLNVKASAKTSICCKFGKIIKKTVI